MSWTTPDGEIMEDFCWLVRYHNQKFSIVGVGNRGVRGYYSGKRDFWEIRTVIDSKGDRYFYSRDWIAFVENVFSRDDISYDNFMKWICEELRIGVPAVKFEGI